MMCYSVMTQAYSENEIPSSPNRSRTYDLPITSSDVLPLSYRRLVGAKAIKQGSWLIILADLGLHHSKILIVSVLFFELSFFPRFSLDTCHLLTQLVRSRWLVIGLVLFFFWRFYGHRLRLGPQKCGKMYLANISSNLDRTGLVNNAHTYQQYLSISRSANTKTGKLGT